MLGETGEIIFNLIWSKADVRGPKYALETVSKLSSIQLAIIKFPVYKHVELGLPCWMVYKAFQHTVES